MADMSRDEVLTRYRHWRALAMRHHTEALKFLSRSALLEQARQLGLTSGKTMVADSIDEMTLVFDLAIYTNRLGHSRAIDRYARQGQRMRSAVSRQRSSEGHVAIAIGEAEAKSPTYGALPWAVLAPPLRSQRLAH